MKRSMGIIVTIVLAVAMVGCLGACSSESYTPSKNSPTIDPNALVTSGVLTVGVNASRAPFAMEIDDEIVGLDVDVAAALADELGLNLQVVDIGDDVDGAIDDGLVDIVMGINAVDTGVKCWTSEVYVESAIALFGLSDETKVPTEASHPSIAAEASSMSAFVVTEQFGASALKPQNLSNAFSSLNNGTVDYVAADAVIGSFVVNSNNYDMHIVALLQRPSGYCVGASNTNTALKTAVANGLADIIDDGIVNVIETRWLGVALDLYSYQLTPGARSATTTAASSEESSESGSESEGSGEGTEEAPDANAENTAGQNAVEFGVEDTVTDVQENADVLAPAPAL